jgi:hypothetical protein
MKQCKKQLKLQETNPFPWGLCYVVSKGKKNTTRKVLKIVVRPFKIQFVLFHNNVLLVILDKFDPNPILVIINKLKPYIFLGSGPRGLEVQIQG